MLECDNVDDIITLYDEQSLDFRFEERFNHSMAIAQWKDAATDVKVCEFIRNNIRLRNMFTISNHPKKELILEVIRQIMAIICERGFINAPHFDHGALFGHWPDDQLASPVMWPVDSYSRKHFRFLWLADEHTLNANSYYRMLIRNTYKNIRAGIWCGPNNISPINQS